MAGGWMSFAAGALSLEVGLDLRCSESIKCVGGSTVYSLTVGRVRGALYLAGIAAEIGPLWLAGWCPWLGVGCGGVFAGHVLVVASPLHVGASLFDRCAV
eukprot:5210165-Pyramimonas_sp.AAC.1